MLHNRLHSAIFWSYAFLTARVQLLKILLEGFNATVVASSTFNKDCHENAFTLNIALLSYTCCITCNVSFCNFFRIWYLHIVLQTSSQRSRYANGYSSLTCIVWKKNCIAEILLLHIILSKMCFYAIVK